VSEPFCIPPNNTAGLPSLPLLVGKHVAAVAALRDIVARVSRDQNTVALAIAASIRANLMADRESAEREISVFRSQIAAHADPEVAALIEARGALILSELDQALLSMEPATHQSLALPSPAAPAC
jgi:hypothetical protein